MGSMLLKTGRGLVLATLLAAGGFAILPTLAGGPAFAQNGGGGGDGGGSGGGGGGGGSGTSGLNDVYAVIHADAASRGRNPAVGNARGRGGNPPLTHVPGPNNPHPPQRGQYTSMVGDHGGGCGGRGALRIIYDINGEPLRYACMPVR